MKHSLLCIVLLNTIACFAQQEKINDFIFKAPQIVYYGIDFSHAQIIKESPGHKSALQDSLLQKINLKFLSEQIGWLQFKLSKEILIEDRLIHSINSKYTDMPLIPDSIPAIIKGYNSVNKTGTGLVFIVASLDKPDKKVELYPVFFDISSKSIIWIDKEPGTAHGGSPGLMQFWYSKVYNSIGNFIDTYTSHKAEKNGRIKPNNIFLKVFINEIGLGYERTIDPAVNISIEAGYRFNYLDSWENEGSAIPVEYLYRFLAFQGFTFRLDLKCKVSRRSYLSPVFGYQRLYCPKVIWNPGGFAGTDDEEYKVWSQHNDEYVIQLIHYISLGYFPYPVQFFYGVGLKICTMSEQYSIDGYPNYKKPSDKHVNDAGLQPLITFGLNIKLVSF